MQLGSRVVSVAMDSVYDTIIMKMGVTPYKYS